MHMHFSLLSWFQRVMAFVLLTLLLVCADKEEASMVGLSNHTITNVVGNQKQGKKQLGMKPYDLYLSRKRKVPNASDPLHNR